MRVQRWILTPPLPSSVGSWLWRRRLRTIASIPYIQPREALHSNKHTFKCNVGTRTYVSLALFCLLAPKTRLRCRQTYQDVMAHDSLQWRYPLSLAACCTSDDDGSRLANADRFSLDSTVFVPSQPIAGLCLPTLTAATNAYAKRKTGGKQRDAVLSLFNRIIHDGTFAAVYVVVQC